MRDWKEYVRRQLGEDAPEGRVEELAQYLEDANRDGTRDLTASQWTDLRKALRERKTWWPWPGLGRDVRFGIRGILRSPGFALTALGAFALGTAAIALMGSAVYSVLLQPLPFDAPERLAAIEMVNPQRPGSDSYFSGLDFQDLRSRARSWSSIAAISPVWSFNLTGNGEAERVEAQFVSANLLPTLGVAPAAGRGFVKEEDAAGHAAAVAMVSHRFWQRRWHGAAGAIGSALTLDGQPYTVIGVLPAGFEFAAGENANVEIWLPLQANPFAQGARSVRLFALVGRLAGGVDLAVGRAEIETIWNALTAAYPEANRGLAVRTEALAESTTKTARRPLMALLALTLAVLLVACVNVANLFLARVAGRGKEFSTRIALGATRMRIVAQLISESFVLAALGGLIGIGIARACLGAVVGLLPATLPRREEISFSGWVIAATLAAAVLCALMTAWMPGRSGRKALVIAEAAMATVLVVGAALMVRSFAAMLATEPGFRVENVYTLSTHVPVTTRRPAERTAFYNNMQERLSSIPGVRNVAAVSRLPLLGSYINTWLHIEGRLFPPDQRPEVGYRVASSSYFPTIGIPLRSGRLFAAQDDLRPQEHVLINEALASQYFGGASAIGKRLKFGPNPEQQQWAEIIGIVGNVRHFGLDVAPQPEVYRPYRVNPLISPVFVIATDGTVSLRMLRAAMREAAPDSPVYNAFAMQELVDRAAAHRRFPMMLLSLFAVLALLLAAIGVYGVLSEIVTQRKPEFGVRMSLGATASNLVMLVLGHGMRMVFAGLALGVALSYLAASYLASLLYGIVAWDTVSFLCGGFLLAVSAAIACWLPARRAGKTDPSTALRGQ